ncbi:hematopoietic progenitor cell antigen CD34 [Echinops telfairi]|uniref:Hematopoietic progenitor cell antigen CD34 n=1 Tax=Echinops telfairi TaxID=9371 RepID=A0ABM0ZPT3_ECHTE|nr:hematopoietic progenitor cell antigen CD34 [Echinops telfairi]
MLGRSGARAGSRLPRGWIALCWLSLLPLGLADPHNVTAFPAGISSAVFTNVSNQGQEATTLSILESFSPNHTSPNPVSQDSNVTTGTQLPFSESTVNFTSTSGITPIPGTMNSSVQTQTSRTTPVSTTPTNLPTSGKTLEPSTFAGNISDGPANSTSPMVSYTQSYTSSPSTPVTITGEITCLEIKEVKLTQGICLEQNETTSCEDFKKDKGEDLIRLLCEQEQVDPRAGGCSLLLTQSDTKPQCLMLVLANRTELSSKLQLMGKHQSDLGKLGIHSFTAESVGSHQRYSRKTLIALVTSGILLAILGTTGYFLMNRRSWSPTGERLGEDPYYTESSGGQGNSSGPRASPEAQGKASVNQGAQENGTGQATSRNGHSTRQHVVADTEL